MTLENIKSKLVLVNNLFVVHMWLLLPLSIFFIAKYFISRLGILIILIVTHRNDILFVGNYTYNLGFIAWKLQKHWLSIGIINILERRKMVWLFVMQSGHYLELKMLNLLAFWSYLLGIVLLHLIWLKCHSSDISFAQYVNTFFWFTFAIEYCKFGTIIVSNP